LISFVASTSHPPPGDRPSAGREPNRVEPAILESFDGGTLAVLLPGAYSLWDAAVESMAAVQDYAAERGIDMDDPDLGAVIHPAGWVVLHHCDAPDHDFHPQECDAGTPGAILVTRVDLELNYGVVSA
jgi:hypothetical protein